MFCIIVGDGQVVEVSRFPDDALAGCGILDTFTRRDDGTFERTTSYDSDGGGTSPPKSITLEKMPVRVRNAFQYPGTSVPALKRRFRGAHVSEHVEEKRAGA